MLPNLYSPRKFYMVSRRNPLDDGKSFRFQTEPSQLIGDSSPKNSTLILKSPSSIRTKLHESTVSHSRRRNLEADPEVIHEYPYKDTLILKNLHIKLKKLLGDSEETPKQVSTKRNKLKIETQNSKTLPSYLEYLGVNPDNQAFYYKMQDKSRNPMEEKYEAALTRGLKYDICLPNPLRKILRPDLDEVAPKKKGGFRTKLKTIVNFIKMGTRLSGKDESPAQSLIISPESQKQLTSPRSTQKEATTSRTGTKSTSKLYEAPTENFLNKSISKKLDFSPSKASQKTTSSPRRKNKFETGFPSSQDYLQDGVLKLPESPSNSPSKRNRPTHQLTKLTLQSTWQFLSEEMSDLAREICENFKTFQEVTTRNPELEREVKNVLIENNVYEIFYPGPKEQRSLENRIYSYWNQNTEDENCARKKFDKEKLGVLTVVNEKIFEANMYYRHHFVKETAGEIVDYTNSTRTIELKRLCKARINDKGKYMELKRKMIDNMKDEITLPNVALNISESLGRFEHIHGELKGVSKETKEISKNLQRTFEDIKTKLAQQTILLSLSLQIIFYSDLGYEILTKLSYKRSLIVWIISKICELLQDCISLDLKFYYFTSFFFQSSFHFDLELKRLRSIMKH